MKKHIIQLFIASLIALVSLSCTKKTSSKINSEYITNKDVEIYFETYGSANNPTLVLIHGNGGHIETMRLQIDFFKDSYYVIVADNRTHGKSGDCTSLTYHDMASDYIAILNHLNIDKANILGQSDGGIIGLIMAMEYPTRINKLISAVPNTIASNDVIADWEVELSKNYRRLIDSMLLVNDQSRNWKREKIHMELMKNEPNIAFTELTKVKCPVLLITSDDDIIKPRHILDIYEHLPNAQLFMMPGATHFMIRDEHELFNYMCNRFLTEPFKRPRSKEVLYKILEIQD